MTTRCAKISFNLFLAVVFLNIFCPALKAEIDSCLRYMPSRSLKAQPGKISLIDSELEYSYEFKAFGELPLELSLDSRYIDIKDNAAVGVTLPAHLTGIGAGVEATLPFFKFNRTYLHLKLMPAFYADDWEAHASCFRLPVYTFLTYQPDGQWTFIAGIAVYPDFENQLWPILGFIYKPNDKLTFNLTPGRPNISYIFSQRITLFTEGRLLRDEFEVTKDNLKGASLRYNEIYMGAGMKFKVSKSVAASVSIGRTFNRYLKYRDSLGKVSLKNDLYSQLRIEIEI